MYQNFKQKWHKCAMETRDHSKNGASSKSQTSRGNFLFFGMLLFALCLTSFVFTSCKKGKTTDPGVIINGVKWATRNVDEAGTFVPTSESLGKLYQWNRKKAFPNSMDPNTLGAMPEWDDNIPSGIKWEKVNDPSPAGWRVPTYDEIASLLDKDKVSNKFFIQNGVLGLLFTDKTTGNTLFIPVQSYFDENRGLCYINPSNYWSNAQFATNRGNGSDNTCHSLFIPGQDNAVRYDNLDNIFYDVRIRYFDENSYDMKININSIRCVEDIPPSYEVTINGVRWATCNVDEFGTFAASSRATGKLYQWNRKKAWSPTEGLNKSYDWNYTDWDKTYPNGTSWEETNDPSPTGWRVPTKEEIESLLDENKVSRQLYHEGSGNYGIYDFEGVLFTDKTTGHTLRLPLTGNISGDGRYYSISYGYYWSNAIPISYGEVNEHVAYGINFMKSGDLYGKVVNFGGHHRNNGYAIRSVRK